MSHSFSSGHFSEVVRYYQSSPAVTEFLKTFKVHNSQKMRSPATVVFPPPLLYCFNNPLNSCTMINCEKMRQWHRVWIKWYVAKKKTFWNYKVLMRPQVVNWEENLYCSLICKESVDEVGMKVYNTKRCRGHLCI